MKQRGQSLTETALVLPILLLVLIGSVDILTAGANVLIGKHLTARAARGAALSTVPDGVTSCAARVDSLMTGDFFLLAESTYQVSNCPTDPYQGITQGSAVSVTMALQFHPIFLPGDLWLFTIQTIDYGR